jgi:glycosyltransferase involved in cell wall biosynthesis
MSSLSLLKNPNLSFVMVDDCSQDSTSSVIRDWIEKDARFLYVKTEANSGISCALNHGLAASSADYIFRLDSDDITEENRVSLQLEKFKSDSKIALCTGNAYLIDSLGNKIGHRQSGYGFASSKAELYYFGNSIIHSSTAFRREVCNEVGRYSIRMTGVEDYDLWMRMVKLGKISNVNKQIIQYRIHDYQITSTFSKFRQVLVILCCSIHVSSSNIVIVDKLPDQIWQQLYNLTEGYMKQTDILQNWYELTNIQNRRSLNRIRLKVLIGVKRYSLVNKLSEEFKKVLSSG